MAMSRKTTQHENLEEQAFRAMMQRASQPEPPAGSLDRLMRRVAQEHPLPVAGNVVTLRQPSARPIRKFAFAALPLAASLLLGILIGSDSMPVGFLPDSVASLIQPAGYDLDVPDLLGDSDGLEGDLA